MKPTNPSLFALVALLAAACLYAQQPPQTSTAGDVETAARSLASEIILGPGDTIQITALSYEELSKDWRIGESGTLHLPLVGSVDIAGQSVAALEKNLNEIYSEYLIQPKINVFVSEMRSRPVTIVGAVHKPGTHQLNGPTSLFHMLQQAGGITEQASGIVLVRDPQWGFDDLPHAKLLPEGKVEVQFSLEDVLKGHGREAQVIVRPFDVINVEPKRDRLVYIAGEVTRPGAILLETANGVRLTKALAVAGGYKTSASFKHTYLWRGDNDAAAVEVDIKSILRGESEDILLREGDYLIIPPKSGLWTDMSKISSLTSLTASALIILDRL